jgi:hypothetical protein
MQKTKEFPLGKITYRTPNVVEAMRWFSKLGVRADGSVKERQDLEIMADLIENLEPFIVCVEAEKDGVKIGSWAEALAYMECVTPLTEIAGEFMQMFGNSEQGKRRKKS